MTAPKVSEAEFIELWKQHGSPSAVGKVLGSTGRVVHERKKRIERRHGIRLPTIDPIGRKAYDQSALVTADRVEVKLTIQNGVVLVISDQHFWPGHVPTMHRAFCYLAKKLKPYAAIWNGDAFDGSSISRHPSIGWEKSPTVKEELECVRDRSYEVKKACPSAILIWDLGNHCMRFETRLAMVASEYRDVEGIHLKDHFPEWIPAWFTTINEGTASHTEIRHRENGGIHASYNNTLKSGVSIVTGHDHRADVVAYDDRRGRRYGVRAGMGAESCRDSQFVNYLEGRKTNWQSACAVLTYKDGMLLQPELALQVKEGVFEFRGELIAV